MKTNFNKLGIGTRINLFDNTEGMVYDFDKLFPECPLPERFARDELVTIENYIGANCRMITVEQETIRHKMFADLLYNVDRDLFHMDETENELDNISGHPV